VPREALPGPPGNVRGLVFCEHEAGYLAGHVAASMAGLGGGEAIVSAVGGERTGTVERFIAGHEAGARSADPGVITLRDFTGGFVDPAKGRAVALDQIARGPRVVFQVASSCGLGALEAARESGVWAIGVDTDQSDLGPHVTGAAAGGRRASAQAGAYAPGGGFGRSASPVPLN